MAWEPHLIVDVSYYEPKGYPVSVTTPLITTLRLKNLQGETKFLNVPDCEPRYWTEVNQGTPPSKKSIEGADLWEVRCDQPSEIKESAAQNYPHYCADVPWPTLVRWIYGWTTVIEVNTSEIKWDAITTKHIRPSEVHADAFELETMWFDIETEDSLDTEGTDGRIVSIAFLRADGAHEIGTTAPTSPRQVKRFMQSQKALESVVEHTSPIPPVEGEVFVENFSQIDEDEREAALLWWFKQRIEELDPDVLAGQNIKDYDIPYLRNRCKNQNRAMTSRHGGNVPVHHRYPSMKVLNRPLFDSKLAYAEQVRGAAATTGRASLSWMATSELGYGKVPRTRITELMKRDPMMLAVYNAWDNVCAERVCTKLDLINFYLIKTGFHNSTLRNSHTNMMLIEDMMGHLLMDEGKIMPSVAVVRERTTGEIEQGGHVMEAPVGVWRNAFELDNSMEYPSAIISGNFSPDTVVQPANEYPWPVTITPAGRVYRRDFEGIMPRVLRTLAELRRKTQQQMRETDDPALAGVLNQKQRVIKENMNSWYGVLGSGTTSKTKGRPFRLTAPGIGSDVTEIARIHNDWNKEHIGKWTLGFDEKLGVTPQGSDDFQLEFTTLYQDTDSCKVAIKNHDEAEEAVRPFTEDDVIAISDQLSIMLNDTYDDFVKQYLNVDKNEFFLVKRDAAYERYFSWGVKKRYAYRLFDGTQGHRGVEMRRSSAPQVVKDSQARLFDAILDGETRDGIVKLLRQIHTDIMDEEKTPAIHFGTPMGMKTDTTQQYKAAMWSNKNLGTDFDIGDKPVIYFASNTVKGLPSNKVVALEYSEKPEDHGVIVDRERSFDKHFKQSASWKAILSAFNTNWENALAGVHLGDFSGWFE